VAVPSPHPTPKPAKGDPAAHREEATAAGIYGIIVSAAVMAAAHTTSAIATDVAVLVTLIVYWAAERYSRIVAERIHQGHRPSSQTVREQVTSGWEMVTASFIPLAVLAVVRVAGASLRTATIVALICSTVLLCVAGWRVGEHGRLSRPEQVISTLVAGVFGAAMILLKTLLH
jgi:VIT1/CCC1 family predicted Fe2+/Mn2+ transporter